MESTVKKRIRYLHKGEIGGQDKEGGSINH